MVAITPVIASPVHVLDFRMISDPRVVDAASTARPIKAGYRS
jgi:hypothetical protein